MSGMAPQDGDRLSRLIPLLAGVPVLCLIEWKHVLLLDHRIVVWLWLLITYAWFEAFERGVHVPFLGKLKLPKMPRWRAAQPGKRSAATGATAIDRYLIALAEESRADRRAPFLLLRSFRDPFLYHDVRPFGNSCIEELAGASAGDGAILAIGTPGQAELTGRAKVETNTRLKVLFLETSDIDNWPDLFRYVASAAQGIFLFPAESDGLVEEMLDVAKDESMWRKTIVFKAPGTPVQVWENARNNLARCGIALPHYLEGGIAYLPGPGLAPLTNPAGNSLGGTTLAFHAGREGRTISGGYTDCRWALRSGRVPLNEVITHVEKMGAVLRTSSRQPLPRASCTDHVLQ